MTEKDIDKIYSDNFFPTLGPLYKLVKKEFPEVKKITLKEFLEKQVEQQLTKQQKINPSGHITAIAPNEIWQIDIFVMQKYGYDTSDSDKVKTKSEYYNKDRNQGYNYIFACVDVFTRFSYAVKMKTKSIDDTTTALETILKKSKNSPHVISSDNDSSFLGAKFQTLLKKYDIIHIQNVKEDHNALGIIDNFAKRLKSTFTKIFLRNNSTNWVNYLDDVVDNFNHRPNTALEDLSPYEVDKNEDNLSLVLQINQEKMNFQNKVKNKLSNLVEGDLVRIKVKNIFSKGTEPIFSKEIYTVMKIAGNRIKLDNGKEIIRSNLLKIPSSTERKIDYNVIEKVNKENRIQRKNKKEGIDSSNIINIDRVKKVMKYL